MNYAQTFVIFLSVIWGPYFLALWLFWYDCPGEKPGVKRYEVLMRYLKPKKKAKLCRVHGGKMADKMCVICKARKAWKI